MMKCGFALRAIAATVAAITVSACGTPREQSRLVGYDVHPVVITSVNPPKHFAVDVRDEKTGVVFSDVARSKRCGGWQETAVVGRSYQGVFSIYVYPNGTKTYRLDEEKLHTLLCR